MGAIQQQGPPGEAAALKATGPAGRRQSARHGGGIDRPAPLRQALGRAQGHGGVVPLQITGQTKPRSALSLRRQWLHPTQIAAQGQRLPLQNRCGLWRLRPAHRHRTGMEHTGLLGGDSRQGGAQVFGVIKADAGKSQHLAIGVHRGGIEPPPQPHLQHHQLHAGLGEGLECSGRHQLKGGEVVAEGKRLQGLEQAPQLRLGDQTAGQADALAPAQQVGRGVKPAADAGGGGDALQHCAD